ncbi:MAG: MerR family transcriptional regulator, partial [Huintestinicola sp.]
MKKTLSEVVEIVGMSRRVIQEYEEAGLSPKPDTRNKYNHLLYDDKTIQGLCKIRFYRDMGYNKEQIKAILADNDSRSAITSQINVLERKKEKIEAAIAVAKVSDKMGLTPLNVRSSLPFAKAISYDMLFSMLGTICGCVFDDKKCDEGSAKVLTEEDYEALTENIEIISECFGRGLPYVDNTVQDNVKGLHRIASKALSESIIFLSIINLCLSPETKLSEDFDELFVKGFSEYLFSAVKNYCIAGADNPADRVINNALERLEALCK